MTLKLGLDLSTSHMVLVHCTLLNYEPDKLFRPIIWCNLDLWVIEPCLRQETSSQCDTPLYQVISKSIHKWQRTLWTRLFNHIRPWSVTLTLDLATQFLLTSHVIVSLWWTFLSSYIKSLLSLTLTHESEHLFEGILNFCN